MYNFYFHHYRNLHSACLSYIYNTNSTVKTIQIIMLIYMLKRIAQFSCNFLARFLLIAHTHSLLIELKTMSQSKVLL